MDEFSFHKPHNIRSRVGRSVLLPWIWALVALSGVPTARAGHVRVTGGAPAGAAAVSVVRRFLDDRKAGRRDAAYALLSADVRRAISEKALFGSNPLPPSASRRMPSGMFALLALVDDWSDTLHYTFTVVGMDPADPRVVLVRADPPAGAADVPAAVVRLWTESGPGGGCLIDVRGSLEHAGPRVMAQARERVDRWESQSHMKSLALALIQYSQDHEVKLPDAAHWADQVMPYVKSRAVFRDPSAPSGQAWCYAFNRELSRRIVGFIDNPARTVMLFETIRTGRNASDAGQSVPLPGRHNGGTDYAFADGHVTWYPDGTVLNYKPL